MNNINIQVSPRNGVDFSKIRKAQEGLKIPKFLTPAGVIGNRKNTYITLDDWWNSHNLANIAQWLKIASEHPEMTLDELNNFISQNHNLYTTTGYNGAKAIKGEGVNQYQRDYHNKYGFGNTDSFWNGWANAYNGNSLNTGDLRAAEGQEFTGDNYFGEQTNRRLANYFNESELAQANDAVKSRGWHWELADYNDQDNRSGINGRKFYKLVQDGQPSLTPSETPSGTSPGTPPGTTPETPLGTTSGTTSGTTPSYTPLEFPSVFNFKPQPFTSPITNGIIAGLGLAANKHVYDNEMKKKVPLLEAPHHQYITGAYKATVDAYNKAGTDIQSAANRIANQSSNLEQNQAIQLEGAIKAADKRLEGALKQQEGYNFDRGKSLETAYFNSDAYNRIANINRQNLVADWNRRMDAKSKYQLQRNAIWADNIMKNRTDYGQWKANEENERDAALSSYNLYIANLRDQLIKKPYQDLLADASTSNAFNLIYQNALNDWNSKRETSWALNPENRDFTNIWTGSNDEATRRLNFLTYLQTHGDSTYGKQFNEGYTAEVQAAKNKYIQDAQLLQNDLMMIAPSFRNTYTTEGFYNPRRLGKQLRFIKEGGVLKMKRGSRFVDYLEHNRKALKDQKLTTMENVKQAQKTLQKQLEAIDRETLILLRSIFK